MQVAHPLRDGLWDDEEASCGSPSSSGKSFGWQSRAMSSASVETMSTTRAKSFRSISSKKEEGKPPKGKGRRGELRVNLDSGAAYSGPSLPTIVSPSDTLGSSSAISPAPLKSPGFHRPLPLPSPPSCSPVTPSTAASSSTKPSTWAQRAGQSIKRFGRSKSSGNLRSTSGFDRTTLPPVPSRPPVLGLSHSTPPLGESSKVNQQSRPEVSRGRTYKRSFSPPPSQPTVAVSYHYDVDPTSPLDVPSDPFSSPFYTPEESPRQLPGSLRSNSKGMRSPSLRDMRMPSLPSLRDFRPTLSKTKSWASFRNASGPTSAPPEQTSFFPPVPSSFSPASLPLHNHHLACSSPLPKESPPLLPPNPPYFPISNSPLQSPFLPSTPPPASPLPITPSASTPVLLPRSRSTSVSLKAPPTSSSFFDLYEQLGIWPTAEEQAKTSEVETPTTEVKAVQVDVNGPPSRTLPSLPSKSSEILSASWEKAIGSFPFVDSPGEAHDNLDDDEDPGNMADTSLSTVDQVDWLQTPADAGDEQHMHRQRVSGQSESKANGWAGSYRAPADRNSAPRRRSSSNSSSDESDSRRRTALESGSEEGETDSGEDSDDVPLGQRIPGAVDVQRDLRAREKAKRHKRKKLASSKAPKPRPVQEGVETLNEGKQWNGEGGVAAEVLRQKLEAVVSLGPVAGPSVLSPRLQEEDLARKASQRQAELSRRPTQTLRAQRSFTNPQTSPNVGADLARRHTDRRSGPSTSRAPPMPANAASTSSSMSRRDKAPIGLGLGDFTRRTGDSDHSRLSAQGAESSEMRSRQRSHSGSQPSAQSSRKPSLAPIITGASRVESPVPSPRLRSTQKSPMPHLPQEEPHRQRSGSSANAKAPLALVKPEILRQQRAFVGSLQGKALQLEISVATRARDILDWATKEGELSTAGDEWVMYEVFAELGCERPLREFELLTDVMHGWNQEARVNTFLFRQSRAAGKTLARAIPRIPPYVGAYVQYESKKGKWSKRWLETREGSVFLAKNDRQKDETFICLAASFDVYAMTRPYKAPKSFTFVLKSQDSAVLFEDPTDYLHIFSSEDSTAHKMIDAIYQARSTSLIIDKPQLLHAIPATRSTPSPNPQCLQSPEVGTVRTGFLGRRKTTKPLLDVASAAPKTSSPFTGGLLGRRV